MTRPFPERLARAVASARSVTTATIPLAERRAEIIDVTLQGATVPELRAALAAHGVHAPARAPKTTLAAALRDALI